MKIEKSAAWMLPLAVEDPEVAADEVAASPPAVAPICTKPQAG